MKNLSILIALILILHAGIRGQSFTAHDISQFDPIVGTINSISIADLNNDNRKDFIVFKASGLDVYLDKLNKQPEKKQLSTVTFYNGISFDYNNDGLDDIIGTGATINFYKNTGAGNFSIDTTMKVDTTVTFSYRHIDTVDLNNDNKVDIVVSVLNSSSDRYYCFALYNKGQGRFSRPYNLNSTFSVIAGTISSQYTVRLKVVDYDNNGTKDISFVTSSNGTNTLLNNGNNAFSTLSNTNLNNDIADIDNDGDYDGYFVSTSNLYLRINGGATYTNKLIGNMLNVKFTKFVDVDGDNKVDILCGKSVLNYEKLISDNLYYYKNIDGSNFVKTLIDSTVNNPYKDAYISDINMDGKKDVVGLYMSLSCQTNYSIVKYIADSNRYEKEWFIQFGRYNYNKWVDIDNDALPDYVYNYGKNSKLFWLKNKGHMQLDKPRVLLDSLPYQNCASAYDLTAINFDDINNDGLTDIYGCLEGKFFSSQNLGNQKYAPYNYIDSLNFYITYTAPAYSLQYNNILFVDINSDNIDDIIYVSSYSVNKVYYSLSSGNGKFSRMYEVSNTLMKRTIGVSHPLDLVVQDMDNDGRNDLLYYPAVGDNLLFWFKNNGNTTFTENFFYDNNNLVVNNTQLQSNNGLYVNVTDINNDNKPDLISNHKWIPSQSNGKYTTLRLLINNKYTAEKNYQPDFYDLNNDGKKDLIMHNIFGPSESNDSLFFHKGLGNGVFDSVSRFIYKKSINNIAPLTYSKTYLDIDGDNDLDISCVDYAYSHGSLLILENKLNDNNTINVQCFWDKNQNKIWDNGEQPLNNQKIYSDIATQFAITNDSGSVSFYLPNGGSHNVYYKSNFLWKPTTDSTYNISLPQDMIRKYLIGLKPNNLVDSFTVSLVASPSRCQRNSNLWITVNNLGNTIISGADTLKINSLLTYISAVPVEQNIDATTKYWSVNNLNPTSNYNILADVRNPNVVSITDSAKIRTYFIGKSTGFSQYKLSTDTYTNRISCSFDPNFKTVEGIGVSKDSFTLKTNPIEYTIHFQNTGSDTAYKVVITDTIDTNLDISTIVIISSSHQVNTNVKNSVVSFDFNNINLVDSVTNERLSHGYIRFRISPKINVINNITVKNNAHIIFDFNDAVRTNTTKIILVDSLTGSSASFLSAGNDKTVCIGETVILTATGATSYIWSTGANTASITVSPTTTTSYIVTGTVNGVSQKDTVVLNVKPLPIVNIGNDRSICFGDSVTLTATTNGTSLLWNTGLSSNSITVKPITTTNYSATATLNGCTSFDGISVAVKPLPNVNFTKLLNASEVKLTAPNGNTTYNWNFGDGSSTSSTQNPTHTYATNGKKYITLVSTLNGCTSQKTDSVTIAITAIKNNISFVDKIEVFPNPADDFVSVQLKSKKAAEFRILLISIDGKIIVSREYKNTTIVNDEISLKNYSSGVYFLQIESENEQATYQLIKN
jgi:hypothetical protein